MGPPETAVDMARRLFAAIEAGDIETVREMYAPDARIWHNTDGVTQTADEKLRSRSDKPCKRCNTITTATICWATDPCSVA